MPPELVRTALLQPGDRVRLVSPASYPDASAVATYVDLLERWGLKAEVAEHALDRHGYMAGTDRHRLRDLNEAFRDPGVRAIIATRGGAGAYRIADDLDFDAIREDPKPVVGFSDITYLHLAILKHCGVGGIHGCLVGPTATASVRQLLMTTDPITLQRTPRAMSALVEVAGRAEGRLVGGNLAAVATSVGVRLPVMAGAILFLEDQRAVGLGTVDRQLTQLVRSGALDGIVGIALGSFEGFRDYEDRGWTIRDVLLDRLAGLGVPLVGGIFAGHDLTTAAGAHDQSALPIGSFASVDADAGTLTIAPVMG